MKNFYIAVDVKDSFGKYVAYVLKVSESTNIAGFLSGVPDCLMFASIAPTKKAAYELAQLWNRRHERDGNNKFSA